MDIDKIKKLWKISVDTKEKIYELYKTAMQYALPNENEVGTSTDIKTAENLYDSTCMIENAKLARKQVNMILPTNLQWGGLKTDMNTQDNNSQDSELLQVYGSNTYKVLVNSNLNKEALGYFLNLGIGTSCMKMVYTGNLQRPVEFLNIPIANFSFLEGANGKVTHVFVVTENLRKDQLISMFSTEEGGNSELDSLDEDKKYKITESVVPNEEGGGYTYLVTTEGFDTELYKVEDLTYNPFVVCRTVKVGNSIWGAGVVINVLPNVVNVNNAKYQKRVAGKAGIKPALAYEGDPKHMTRFNIELGKMFYLGARGQNTINPLNLTGNINVELMNIQEDLEQIKEGMFSSYISNIGQGIQPKSATEWQFRNQEFLEVFSANYNMIEEEFLIPVFMNTLKILCQISYNGMQTSVIDSEKTTPVFYNKLTENYKQEKIQSFNACIQNLLQLFGSPQAVLGIMDIGTVIDSLTDWYDADKALFVDKQQAQQYVESYIQSMIQQQTGGV